MTCKRVYLNLSVAEKYGSIAAYVFERNLGSSENWGEVTKLTGSDTEIFDQHGFATAVYSNPIVVVAPFEKSRPGNPSLADVNGCP
jgi:hypothetical protein